VTALAGNRAPNEVRWKYKIFTLASGQVAYQGAELGYNRSTNKVSKITSGATTLIPVGTSVDKVDATSADADVNVDLGSELTLFWCPNATGGDAVASTDVLKDVYWTDDQTVTITSTLGPLAGRVWAVDSTKGVLVEMIRPRIGVDADSDISATLAAPAFASNDSVPTDITAGAIYSIPSTGAASTVTLPAAAADGTVAYFVADGSANGHTVQYRDATGPANLTTALTASKRHLVVVTKTGGKWFANAYVSP